MDLGSRTEKQIRLLADSRHRSILTTVRDADRPLHVDELADRLVAHEVFVVSAGSYEDRRERARLSLHHQWLPGLAEVDLLEYDRETNVVTHRPEGSLDIEWEDEQTMFDALASHLPTSHEASEDGIGIIRGRDTAIQYGRQLADVAEEELFCMYVSTDLLGEECIRCVGNAIDRGVTMYLGSQNPDVRALAGERLPEATIWEPQLDWMNTPSYPRVGRLVLADRRKVMLAILDDPKPEETHPRETALVGDGEDNPLVVLVRELLGSRLDHLDYQSDTFSNALTSEQ